MIVIVLGAFLYRWKIAASEQPAGTKLGDYASRITRYSLEGRFDKAIEEGQLALKIYPGNPAILSQVAMVCLLNAKKEPAQHEEWIRKGSEYALDAVRNSSEKEPMTIGYVVVETGKILELAGDLSAEKCTYYREAVDVLENRGPTLKSDTTVVDGKVVSLAPLIDQKAKTLAELQKKTTDARCDK
ncbi:MAG: hypothetical protein ABR920_10015 [Terriglobales bacterium]